jgi:hypothetical protein
MARSEFDTHFAHPRSLVWMFLLSAVGSRRVSGNLRFLMLIVFAFNGVSDDGVYRAPHKLCTLCHYPYLIIKVPASLSAEVNVETI